MRDSTKIMALMWFFMILEWVGAIMLGLAFVGIAVLFGKVEGF